jgi:hypothetical protein
LRLPDSKVAAKWRLPAAIGRLIHEEIGGIRYSPT